MGWEDDFDEFDGLDFDGAFFKEDRVPTEDDTHPTDLLQEELDNIKEDDVIEFKD